MTKSFKFILGVVAATLLAASPANAAIIYSADFSTPGLGVTHDTTSGSVVFSAPSPFIGPNWSITYDESDVSSDLSSNEFITDIPGVMIVQDWGGVGTLTSETINITDDGTVDIIGIGESIGTDAFNNLGDNEGITWFYSINSGAAVTEFLGEVALGGPVASGTDVSNTFGGVSVAAGDTLEVGFFVNVDGAGDGVSISSVEVDFTTAIPEPSSFAALALISVPVLVRRRKRNG
ncbi:MAG: hypothetical protein AAFU85_08795 [Planctomycetota bacterium]